MTEKSNAFDPTGLGKARRERRESIHLEAKGNAMQQAFERAQQETIPDLTDQGDTEQEQPADLDHSEKLTEAAIKLARDDPPPFITPPFVPAPSVPKPPVMQSTQPSVLTAPAQVQSLPPDPTLQRQRPLQRKEDRATFEEMGKPPVPLTPEQQELCAWIYLRRQLRAEELMLAERRLGIISQVVGITLGLVSIAGGIIAVRQGLRAAANDYRS